MTAQLPDFIEGLLSPSAYDHPAHEIELIQTHASYVVLAGDFAYKLKKPLNFGFLDYSTLERRRVMCQEEVRLNRRLCPEAYLGVVAIVRANGGHRVAPRGDADVIEYAVKMRRMPAERMMNALLDRGGVDPAHARQLGRVLAAFHEAAETNERIASFGRIDGVRYNWDENFEQTQPYIGRTVTRDQFEAIRAYVRSFIERDGQLIAARASAGRVRDCHGDLRADAVAIGSDGHICVMDCIEFNDRIRFGDVASDLAFLLMDLEFRGHQGLADELAGAYLDASEDETLPLTLDFYKCYRAYVRGKVDGFQIDDAGIPQPQREDARGKASAYFQLALAYATRRRAQALILMMGLTGSGKTYIASGLAARIGAAPVNSDVVRRRGAGIGARERVWVPYATGVYDDEERARTYGAMHERAGVLLAEGRSVVLDASYIRREDREAAQDLARKARVTFLAVQVEADDETTRRHFRDRYERTGASSDGRWEILLGQREHVQKPTEIPAKDLVRVNGGAALSESLAVITGALELA